MQTKVLTAVSPNIVVVTASIFVARQGASFFATQDCRSQSPVGKYFSDAGDSAVRVTRIRKVFPEVGAKTEGTSSSARILSKPCPRCDVWCGEQLHPVSDTNQFSFEILRRQGIRG